MSFHADGDNLKLGRGALFIDVYAAGVPTGGFEFLGNVTALNLSSENETAEKYSSTEQSSPLLEKRVIRQSYRLTAACDEHTQVNLGLFMSGELTSRTQTLDTSEAIALTNVQAGQYYNLDRRGITSVVVTEGSAVKTITTDYTIDTEQGILYIVPGGSIIDNDDITVTFGRPLRTIQQVKGGKVSSPNCALLYIADDVNTDGAAARDRLQVWKASAAPDGDYGFITENDYASFSLTFDVLSDAVNHPNEPFFVLERS